MFCIFIGIILNVGSSVKRIIILNAEEWFIMIYWCTAQSLCSFAKTFFGIFWISAYSYALRHYAWIVSVIKVATWGSRVLIWWEQPETGPLLYRCFIALQWLGPVGAGLVFSLTFITLSVPFYPLHNLHCTKTACQRFCHFFPLHALSCPFLAFSLCLLPPPFLHFLQSAKRTS